MIKYNHMKGLFCRGMDAHMVIILPQIIYLPIKCRLNFNFRDISWFGTQLLSRYFSVPCIVRQRHGHTIFYVKFDATHTEGLIKIYIVMRIFN